MLETAAWEETDLGPVFKRIIQMGPRDQAYYLQVAQHPDEQVPLQMLQAAQAGRSVTGLGVFETVVAEKTESEVRFNGATYLQLPIGNRFNMYSKDFTIAARITTKVDGAIFTKTHTKSIWVDGGKSLFVREGKLDYDIGWVGALIGTIRVEDG